MAGAWERAGAEVASSAKGATRLQRNGIPRRQQVRPGAVSRTGRQSGTASGWPVFPFQRWVLVATLGRLRPKIIARRLGQESLLGLTTVGSGQWVSPENL